MLFRSGMTFDKSLRQRKSQRVDQMKSENESVKGVGKMGKGCYTRIFGYVASQSFDNSFYLLNLTFTRHE